MTKVIANTYDIAKYYRYQISMVLVFGCLVLAILYGFAVYTLIGHTVKLSLIEEKAADISRNIDALDGEYLALSNEITPQNLTQFGMEQGKVTAYINRNAYLGHVSISGNEL